MTMEQMLRREADALRWTGEFARTIGGESAPLYGLSADQAGEYQTTQQRFATAYADWHNPATHTPIQRALKDESLLRLRNVTASLVAVCEAWPQMTDAKREALKIPLRDRNTTAAVLPAAAPTATVVLTGPESVLVQVRNPAEPDRAAKPRGVKSVVVLVAFTSDGNEPAMATGQWPVCRISGKTTIDLMWPNMPADQTAWVACYWLSSRNQVGPISRPQSIRLPGSRAAVRAATSTTSEEPTMKIAA